MNRICINNLNWILLPVEVKAREFESKILLSCFAAEEGYGVILGSQNRFIRYFRESLLNTNKNRLPRGLYIDKSIPPNKLTDITNRIKLGYVYGCLEEEGFAINTQTDFVKWRLSNDTIKLTTIIFAWGNEMAESMVNGFSSVEEKVVITGNPRFDLTRNKLRKLYDNKKQEIINEHGKYIFVPSNFSAAIHASGPEFILKQAEVYGHIKSKKDEEYIRERIRYIKINFERYVEIIPILSKLFSNHKIIIRPHPADNHKCWLDVADSLDNVKIIYRDNATPWILGAEVLVHHGCTTGTEAYCSGVPTIAYLPHRDNRFDWHISNKLSKKVYDPESLIKEINSVLKGSFFLDPDVHKTANKFIDSLEGSFAAERIVDSLKSIEWDKDDLNYSIVEPSREDTKDETSRASINHNKNKFLKRLTNKMKRASLNLIDAFIKNNKSIADDVKPINNENSKKYNSKLHFTKEHGLQKFPGSNVDEVLEIIGAIASALDKFKNIKALELDNELYLIYK